MHDVQDMDVSNLEHDASSRRVRATILISGDDLAILDGDRTDLLCSMSVDGLGDHGRSARRVELPLHFGGGDVVGEVQIGAQQILRMRGEVPREQTHIRRDLDGRHDSVGRT